jgi:two-component system sensor histidine kinase KdpD
LHCSRVQVGEATAAIVAAVEGQLPEGEGHEVEDTVLTAAATIELDLDLVIRAVANLVDNALRYRTPGSRVTIRIDHADERLRVTVRNEGALPDRAERLFDRLTRGEAERSSEGVGLGLSIARAVATRHGGTVTLRAVSVGVVEATIDLSRCGSPELRNL